MADGRDGFGPDACDQDRVDSSTRERLQRLYGSVDLFADMDLGATAEGQYEDVKGLEVIIGDLRAERDRLRGALKEIGHRCDHVERDRREPDKTLLNAASIRGVVIRATVAGAPDETEATS